MQLVLYLMRRLSKQPLQPLQPLQPAGSAAASGVSRREQLLKDYPGSVLGHARDSENKAALERLRRAFMGAGLSLPSKKLGGIFICFGEFLNRLKEKGGPRKVRVSAALGSQP